MNEEKPRKQFIIVKSLVTDDKGKILLVRRDRKWHKEAHEKWEFPGGKIDFGESPEEACIREAKEESGFDVKLNKIIPKILTSKWEHPDRISQQILIAYHCELLGGEVSLKDHGVSKVKWFSMEEAKKLKCLPGTLDFLDHFLNETK